jgi:two-component system KDP operon response regulator KdpE
MALLEAGVSACLARPLDVPELRARIRAASQRQQLRDGGSRRFAVGAAIIDLDARVVRSAGGPIRLTAKECGIVERLAVRPSQTVPASELVKAVWGADPTKGAHSVRKFIQMLRRKLEPDPTQPQYLLTEARLGYRLRGT